MELLMRGLPDIEFHVACPQEPPYWDRFGSLTHDRMVKLPHRRFSFSEMRKLARYVNVHGINLMHAHGKGAAVFGRFLALITGIPCLHTPHGVHVDAYGAIRRRLYLTYEQFTYWPMAATLFVSEGEMQNAKHLGLWQTKPAHIVPNGVPCIDVAAVRALRRQGRAALGLDNKVPVVATLTRFDVQKNMKEAREVAVHCPAIRFVWIGDGPEREQLSAEIRSSGITNVMILGAVDEPLTLLAAADCYLSTSRWEGLPLALLEAMSLGLPLVASYVVGNQDLVQSGVNGTLYVLGRPDLAAEAISELMADSMARERLGTAGRDRQMKEFNLDSVMVMMREIYVRYARISD